MASNEPTLHEETAGLSLNPGVRIDHSEQPPPPVSSQGIIPIDITQKFAAATKVLQPGELIKDSYFTLFEAVGALEIMDPKMDSGCLAPGESLDEEYDVTRPLLPSEVLGIIDQLLSLEMAWHLGYPLSQTLFTNVYIEAIQMPAPANIEEAHFIRDPNSDARKDPMFVILRAYCLGLLKTCWYVNLCIKGEHYYEEEDFVSNTYHRSLLDNIDRDDVRDVLTAARKVAYNLRDALGTDISQALDYRLEVRTALLRAIELSELRSNPESLKLPWKQLKGVWENVYTSHELGTPVPESFSTKIQRKLASTMPPRPIVQLSFEDTYEHFKRLVRDGIEALDILKYSDSQSLLNFVLTFQAKKPQPLIYIRTLMQSFLFKDMIILGGYSIRDIIDDDLAIVVLGHSKLLDRANDNVEAPHDPRFALAHQMELFRQRVAPAYLDIFRAFCQNRCRVRRTLCHAIQDWETIQIDAESIDVLLQVQLDEQPIMPPAEGAPPAYSLPLSSWSFLYKLRLMEWIVQLGFELETYQPNEMAGMYWYLSYLARTRTQHLDRIKTFLTHAFNEHRNSPTRTYTFTMESQYNRTLSYLRTMSLDAMIVSELSDSLCFLYTSLQRYNLLPYSTSSSSSSAISSSTTNTPAATTTPSPPYSDDELRYEVRMKPFAPIGLPELPSFNDFRAASARPDTPTTKLLDYAEQALVAARKGLELLTKMSERETFTLFTHERWLAGTKGAFRSAIAAAVAVSWVQKMVAQREALKGAGGDGELRLKVEIPKPENGYHEWWIVPKISDAK